MKMKKIIILFVTIILLISLCACGRTYPEASTQHESFAGDYFTVIKTWSVHANTYRIIYANDTKVMYFYADENYGNILTPLYNADGTLQIYEGEIK